MSTDVLISLMPNGFLRNLVERPCPTDDRCHDCPRVRILHLQTPGSDRELLQFQDRERRDEADAPLQLRGSQACDAVRAGNHTDIEIPTSCENSGDACERTLSVELEDENPIFTISKPIRGVGASTNQNLDGPRDVQALQSLETRFDLADCQRRTLRRRISNSVDSNVSRGQDATTYLAG